MARLNARFAMMVGFGLLAAPAAQALEPNASDRMREVSEIIVCSGHVSVAAMGLNGQPAGGAGNPTACPLKVSRRDDPRLEVPGTFTPQLPMAMPMPMAPIAPPIAPMTPPVMTVAPPPMPPVIPVIAAPVVDFGGCACGGGGGGIIK